MTLAVSGAAAGTVFGSASGWLADAYIATKNSRNAGGLIGMLANAGDGSLKSRLKQSRANSTNLALISQNSVTNAGSFYAQLAGQAQKERADELLARAVADLQRAQNMVQARNVLDPVIYFSDGSTLDTNGNIMTMVDGTQYDTKTGAKYVDPAFIIQIANGAYLDTKNNILTLSDGTQIDTVTGLKISMTA